VTDKPFTIEWRCPDGRSVGPHEWAVFQRYRTAKGRDQALAGAGAIATFAALGCEFRAGAMKCAGAAK
jgi:hypothetical protein